MVYRNWKQELNDRRPVGASRRPFYAAALAAAVLTIVVCCALWVWPGYLRRDDPTAKSPASAEQLYLTHGGPDGDAATHGEQP